MYPTQQHKHAFTLIELLTVVVIITVILGITAPAFRKLAMGSAVDSAARMLSSQLMLARAEAISRREPVALILPDATKTYSHAEDDLSIYTYSGIRAAIVNDSNEFQRWVENTEWGFVPQGALIREIDTALPNFLTFTEDSSKYIYTLKDDTSFVEDTDHYETVTDSATNKMDHNDKQSSGIRAIIFKPNGRPNAKYYITIMEGVANDTGAPARTNEKNCHVLELNEYTGQVKFIYPGRNN